MPSSQYTLTKCSWRLATHYQPLPATAEELVRASVRVARTFHLSPEEHLRCAERALRCGEQVLAQELSEEEGEL